MHPTTVLTLSSNFGINLDFMPEHGEWRIDKTYVTMTHEEFPGVPVADMTFDKLEFVIHLSRKPKYVIINVLIPCILTVVLVQLVYCLPIGSSDIVGLAVNVLVAFTVFMIITTQSMPRTSEYTPTLSKSMT